MDVIKPTEQYRATASLACLEEQRGNSGRVEAVLDELERSLGPAPINRRRCPLSGGYASQQEQIRNRLKEQSGRGDAFARFARARACDSSSGGPFTPVRWRRELSDKRCCGPGGRLACRSFNRYDIAREGYRDSKPNGQGAYSAR
jgi:hypothetical protein